MAGFLQKLFGKSVAYVYKDGAYVYKDGAYQAPSEGDEGVIEQVAIAYYVAEEISLATHGDPTGTKVWAEDHNRAIPTRPVKVWEFPKGTDLDQINRTMKDPAVLASLVGNVAS